MNSAAHAVVGRGAAQWGRPIAAFLPDAQQVHHHAAAERGGHNPYTSSEDRAAGTLVSAQPYSEAMERGAITPSVAVPKSQDGLSEFEDSRIRKKTHPLAKSFEASLRGRTRRVLARLTKGACRPPRPPTSHCDFVRAPTSLEIIQ